ncbi:MAG: transglycosylase, partial [Desulfobacterales bacterium]|nr:transglycosylase [Desulfobacterales bacterium]
MTRPDACFTNTPGSRFFKNPLLALLCLLLCLSVGCARLSRPAAEKPELPLTLVNERNLPEFFDDMCFDALSASIDQSLAYLGSLSPSSRFLFGDDTYSAAHMVLSLEKFADFLKTVPDTAAVNRYIREHYQVYQAAGRQGNGQMLVTGYYEPFLEGSHQKNTRFRFPLYTRPTDLVAVDLSLFSEKFKGETLWGRFTGKTLVPYHDRREIDSTGVLSAKADVLAWVDDRIDLFFLHIQGSGKLYMAAGAPINVHYNSPNGRPYRSIGKLLIDNGAIPREQMSMQAIKKHLRENPAAVDDILNANPSYVFFNTESEGPIGSIGVRLTPGRSIATDRRIFPKGALAFIKTQKPLVDGNGSIQKWSDFGRFVLNQDTGGAIRGAGRADLFWGNGPY